MYYILYTCIIFVLCIIYIPRTFGEDKFGKNNISGS